MSWKKDNEHNVEFYTKLAEEYGQDVRSLNWGSKESQEMRFKVLCGIGELDGYKILDVGCGTGGLYGWLSTNNCNAVYKGIDLTPKMIEFAKSNYPEIDFEVRNVMEESFEQDQFDYVLASGIFYLRSESPLEFLKEMVTQMFTIAKKGIAFNSLSSWADTKDEDEFYANPYEVVDHCKMLSRKVIFNHGYHPADFTIYVYK